MDNSGFAYRLIPGFTMAITGIAGVLYKGVVEGDERWIVAGSGLAAIGLAIIGVYFENKK